VSRRRESDSRNGAPLTGEFDSSRWRENPSCSSCQRPCGDVVCFLGANWTAAAVCADCFPGASVRKQVADDEDYAAFLARSLGITLDELAARGFPLPDPANYRAHLLRPSPCRGGCGRSIAFTGRIRSIGWLVCSAECSREARNRPRRVSRETLACEWCGASFVPKRRDAKTCKTACRQAAYRERRRLATAGLAAPPPQ
jgi:hypothetical protein